jgi:hypothetical protein
MTKPKDQRPQVSPPSVGLADLRKSHRLTQASVAEQVAAITDEPFYSGSLSLIEGGHRGASASVLRALEQVFGLSEGAMRVDYEPSHSRRKVEDPAA